VFVVHVKPTFEKPAGTVTGAGTGKASADRDDLAHHAIGQYESESNESGVWGVADQVYQELQVLNSEHKLGVQFVMPAQGVEYIY
jgi:hypothetical protein